MFDLTAHTLNNTWIVPSGVPSELTADQLDRAGFVGALNLAWPAIVSSIVILIGSNWRKWTYSPLAVLWLWSVALFSFGIFNNFGQFTHLTNFLAIAHVQVEWLIIGLLLGLSGPESYVLATLIGTVLYAIMLGAPGIRTTFLVSSVGGGFGDTLIPVLLFWGGQSTLALAGVAHFVNALITFINFVQYIPVGPYFALQITATTAHSLFNVIGVIRLQRSKAAIRLETTDEYGRSNGNGNGNGSAVDTPIIPVPDKATFIRLALFSLALSLAASLPLNFGPRW